MIPVMHFVMINDALEQWSQHSMFGVWGGYDSI